MRFVLMIVWALLIILAIFGKNISFKKVLIPFYGWTKWFSKLN